MSAKRFWLLLALLYAVLLGIFGLVFLILSASLAPAQQQLLAQLLGSRLQLLSAMALLLLLGLGAALNALQTRYLQPLVRLSEDVALLSANPEHRATAQGAPVVRVLTDKINTLATNFQMLQGDVQTRIAQANRALAAEKNRLAALMSELAQCVLVCNIEGRILLYNTRATELLEVHDATGTTIGLGRSIFGVIDRDLIVHALEQIQHQRQQAGDPAARPVSDFVATLANGQLVRAHMAAVLDGSNALDGFVLTLEDITRNVAAESQRDALLQSLTQDTRAALANIRAALEAMQHFPDMSSQKRSQFTAIIDDESQRLAHQINQAEQGRSTSHSEGWRFEQMRGIDLIALLQRRIETPALRIASSDSSDSALWLEVDSYALTQSLAYLTQLLTAHCDVSTLHLDLQRHERLAYLDLVWHGAPVAAETLRSWENTPFQLGATNPSTTLTAVITGQGGEAVYQFDPVQQTSRYRLLLPIAT
ncbi:MAG: DNA polymerase III subunit epsilon, partial [Oxalobacteraceae bacterium]